MNLNDRLIESITKKKGIIFYLDKYTKVEDYLKRLIIVLQKNNLKTYQTKETNLDLENIYFEKINELNKEEFIFIIDSQEKINELKDFDLVGLNTNNDSILFNSSDMHSIYNVFSWILNSIIPSSEYEMKIERVISLIPAAGMGTRLGFDKPKILYPINGKPALDILNKKLRSYSKKIIIVGSQDGHEIIKEYLVKNNIDIEVVKVVNSIGNADTILAAKDFIKEECDILIIWGDQIGVPVDAIERIIKLHQKFDADLSMPTRIRKNPYIHLERDEEGKIKKVFKKRSNDQMPEYGENETGIFIIKKKILFDNLDEMKKEYLIKNEKSEFDFLNLISYISNKNNRILTAPCITDEGKLGFNNLEEVKYLEKKLKKD